MGRKRPGEFTVGPGELLKKVFGWTSERRARVKLRPGAVPEELRDLIPLAEAWGVRCDVTRHDVAAQATSQEFAAVASTLAGRHDAIVDWLYSFGDTPVSDEAAVFQSLLILELEECDGPGIPGYLEWAWKKHQLAPSAETLRRLRDAYQFAKDAGVLKYEAPSEVAAIEEAVAS